MALINCNECGKEISDKAATCPNCGAPVEQMTPYNEVISENKLNTNIFTTDSTGFTKKKKGGCLKFFLIFFVAFSVIIGSQLNDLDTNSTSKNQSEFQLVTGTTIEQEEKILNILSECGIKEIKSITRDELLDEVNEDNEIGYRLSTNEVDNIILYLKEDKTLNMLRYADNDLYSDGKVLSIISDYYLTNTEMLNLQKSAKEAILTILKSPSTAKFPNNSEWNIWKESGKIYVKSYVDSQNSFGAELRSEFQFILSPNDLNVESLIFDGKEMISQN